MSSAKSERGPESPRPLSALPSVQARILAFAAILVAGISGGLIGFSTVKVGCRRNCGTPEGVGGLFGAVVAAGGVAIVAVLVLRAMGEWRSIREQRELEMMIAAAAEALTPTIASDEPEPKVENGSGNPTTSTQSPTDRRAPTHADPTHADADAPARPTIADLGDATGWSDADLADATADATDDNPARDANAASHEIAPDVPVAPDHAAVPTPSPAVAGTPVELPGSNEVGQ